MEGSMPRAALALIAAAMLITAALPARAAERVALVIGNGAYTATTRLANPPNDAADMAAALTNLGFEVVAVVDGDLAAMTAAIRRFGKLSAGADVALFYYAGHGIQVGETNYMLPVGAALVEEQDLAFEAIEVGLPLHLMDRSGARVKLVVLDACRNNPLAQTLAGSLEADGRGAAVGRGLARIQGAEGTLMAFATAPGAIADDGKARNSPFTRALLDNIATPGLEVSLLFRRVRADVMAATGDRQVPWVNEALLGEFYFAQPEEVAGDAPAPQATPPIQPSGTDKSALDLAFWDAIKDSDDPASFEAYLAEFPNGTFVRLAQLRLQDLAGTGEVETPTPTPTPAPPVAVTWDFETGDLRGWELTGDAFTHQPTYADNPTARARGQPSNHQGDYWIGTYEKRARPSDPAGGTAGDGPKGTLTSLPFTIEGPTIGFLIGGGCNLGAARVELLVDGQVVREATGKCHETMERAEWDVAIFQGRSARIRLVDDSSGGWGHINFDDVRF
jgi:hypothetical protein